MIMETSNYPNYPNHLLRALLANPRGRSPVGEGGPVLSRADRLHASPGLPHGPEQSAQPQVPLSRVFLEFDQDCTPRKSAAHSLEQNLVTGADAAIPDSEV